MRSIFLFLGVVLVLGVGAAWWFGWWNISTASNIDNGKSEVRLSVDKDKVKHDVSAVEDKVKGGVQGLTPGHHDPAKASAPGQPVAGTIRTIDAGNHSLTVMSDKNEEVTVRTDAATRIRIRDKDAAFLDLKIGDRAAVTYDPAKGGQQAKTVTVETP
ncbi:hypothetical protein AYO44_15320 [Planctomycetaceae bacterium SCGC AG-212-F19]|nr:hypothetical protein AYO44_15320 [Planctomycetaceae bacterium SCGC AG-212-F19]